MPRPSNDLLSVNFTFHKHPKKNHPCPPMWLGTLAMARTIYQQNAKVRGRRDVEQPNEFDVGSRKSERTVMQEIYSKQSL